MAFKIITRAMCNSNFDSVREQVFLASYRLYSICKANKILLMSNASNWQLHILKKLYIMLTTEYLDKPSTYDPLRLA